MQLHLKFLKETSRRTKNNFTKNISISKDNYLLVCLFWRRQLFFIFHFQKKFLNLESKKGTYEIWGLWVTMKERNNLSYFISSNFMQWKSNNKFWQIAQFLRL